MDIVVDSLLEGARRATGVVCVIDVFRAFTTAAVALANGASRIVMTASIEEALALRARGTVDLCMGEARGRMAEGFDFGNSPFAVSRADLRGKAIAQRTSAGAQGIVAARHATRLYATALVTAGATARACLAASARVGVAHGAGMGVAHGAGMGVAHGASTVSLVAMGKDGLARTDEDELCALHIRNLLEGRPGNRDAVRQAILAGGDAGRFSPADPPHTFPEDLEIALDIDRYDFAVAVAIEDGRPVARMERVG